MTEREQNLFSLDTVSQRYSRYEARIQMIRRILDGIWHHRIAAISVVAVLVGLVLCFLSTMGHFIGVPSCQDYIYGDAPLCSAKAFLSDTQFQFSPADGQAVWSDTAPVFPGEYRIRAVSKNGFGKSNYSEDMTFTLLPRELTIKVLPAPYIYGDPSLDVARKNTQTQGLAPGDRITDLEYIISEDEKVGFSASVKDFRIVNSSGQDVTACYTVTTADGYFTMTPRPITIIAKDAQKIYDGMEFSGAAAELTSGSVAEGDDLQISFSPAPAEVGTYLLTPVCAIQNANGEDVSAFYQTTIQEGTLTVLPRPISVRTESAQKQYDGTPLTNASWSVTEGEPAYGQTLNGATSGSQTTAGKSANTIQLSVFDAAGNDVSVNYKFIVETGTLTVTPIVLKFETDSASKVYDGLTLVESGCRLIEGKVLEGHTLYFDTAGRQKYPGSSANTLLVYIWDDNGTDIISDGYEIIVDYGMLTVSRCSITLLSGTAEKLYDGWPLVCYTHSIVSGSLANGESIYADYTGSQTEVGSSNNTFTVEILDTGYVNTTDCYDITYLYGTLTVHENPNHPDTEYDPDGSIEFVDPREDIPIEFVDPTDSQKIYAEIEAISGLQTPTMLYFRGISYGDYIGNGWKAANPYTDFIECPLEYIGLSYHLYGNFSSALKISRFIGCPAIMPYYSFALMGDTVKMNDSYIDYAPADYTANFFCHSSYQDMKYMQVYGYLSAYEVEYRKFVYLQYLQIPETTKKALLAWAEQNGIYADSKTLVEDIQNAIRNAAIYNVNGKDYPEGVDVAVYFLTQAKEGICQHFATAATLMYRAFGIPARYTTGFAEYVQSGTTTYLTNKNAHAWVEIYVDGLGWIPMEVTGGNTVQEEKTELHIQAYSATKYYDGKDFTEFGLNQYTILSGSLREGHRLEVELLTGKYGSTPGKYINSFQKVTIYDENGQDVTNKYYDIYLYDGTLTILKRRITLTIGSASKVYDGMPLTCTDYWISSGSLAPGNELTLEISGQLLDPGWTENIPKEIRIWGENVFGNTVDVTAYYEIIIIPGYLEITEE